MKRVRTAGALLAIALGVATVVWVTCCYESVQRAVLGWAVDYIGRSHVHIESPFGKYTPFALRRVQDVAELEEVKHFVPLLVQRLRGRCVPRDGYSAEQDIDPWIQQETDFFGIDLDSEFAIRDRPVVAGRMLTEADEFACVLEAPWAEETGVSIGDYLIVWDETGQKRYPLEIVGLTERRRIARFQVPLALVRLPVLQRINNKVGFVTAVDVALHDGSRSGVVRAARDIRRILRRYGVDATVRSAMARMQQVEVAQGQQELVLALLSCVAMLTALFIILSTLSMGMLERIAQLGMLRCIGMTGRQLAVLVFYEVVPLGVIGIAAGIPLGLLLAAVTVWAVPEYVGEFVISWRGVALAAVAGVATTVVAASLPALAAWGVSPIEALHPRARRTSRWPLLVACGVALGLFAAERWIITTQVQRDFDFIHWSVASVALLYIVYALAVPLLIWLLSVPAVWVVARLVGVRKRLLQDQIGHAVWRSAGICCGLMVGLSLIVSLVVLNRSFRAGWQFPTKFPEAFVWSFEQLDITPEAARRELARFAEIEEFTVANAPNILVEERAHSPLAPIIRSQSWFLAVEPDRFLDMVNLEFIEGDEATARELLNEGGYVLVASDFARSRRKSMVPDAAQGITNEVKILFGDWGWRTFRVAGVVDSPALDVAASFFQLQSQAHIAAVGSVIGTNADLKRFFNVDGVQMVLLNFDFEPRPIPEDWPPPRVGQFAHAFWNKYFDPAIPAQQRWERWREDQLLRDIAAALGAPTANVGTVRELKERIDRETTRLTYLLTAVPMVALIVAAIGVANLMTANVTSRTRQLAILRAVGATRGQILRMVMGEAVVLGALGSGFGLALGLHLARNVAIMTERFAGYRLPFEVPWPFVGFAIGLTVGLCILAGLLPARHASRTNVIDALHVA